MKNAVRPDAPQRLGRRRPGLIAKEAGKKVGRSARTIRRWSSIPREEWLAQANERREAVKHLRLQGLPMATIAKELDVSIGTVHRYIAEAREAGEIPSEVDNRKPGRPRKRSAKSA